MVQGVFLECILLCFCMHNASTATAPNARNIMLPRTKVQELKPYACVYAMPEALPVQAGLACLKKQGQKAPRMVLKDVEGRWQKRQAG
jgi:hypothetical protein